MRDRLDFSHTFGSAVKGMLKLLFLVTLLIHPMSGMMAQQIMHSVGNHRIEIEGEKMRPGRALSISGSGCPMASDHFAQAKKMRSWNFLTSQFGFAEMLVGILAIDQGDRCHLASPMPLLEGLHWLSFQIEMIEFRKR